MKDRKQYSEELKEQAYAMLVTNSMRYVSRELNIPVGTLAGWKKERDAKAIEQGTATGELQPWTGTWVCLLQKSNIHIQSYFYGGILAPR